eukprot:TRINITY_DN4658_c0_g2_i1.p1 TRINITY_DN4658_c0_g2~~TRINITY_DN4658_c0_g2_i1.p1  ORF type:complete len:974 (+),score=172.47 TRINITY_DN4658_c0_g2_i1:1-2922(+)
MQGYGSRTFYEYPDSESSFALSKTNLKNKDKGAFLRYVQNSQLGEGISFATPFGEKRVIYCDYIASGRSLKFIEDYIQTEVLPFYGNTHTTTSITGRQSTYFRHEARDIIKQAVNGSEDDVLLFVGTGVTGAIHKLKAVMGLENEKKEDIVVFVGPIEHHSNILPWRELGALVVPILESRDGGVDLSHLRASLEQHSSKLIKIGAFSAASNVTGVLCDQNSVTALLHEYNALALWDFATAGPYVKIDMNPTSPDEPTNKYFKDAIFLSPHKFVGGVSTPGLLIAKRNLFRKPAADCAGGGTVFFVSRKEHRFLKELEFREEGGTPDIVGSVRAGLVFQLKQTIGQEEVDKRLKSLVQKGYQALSSHPNIHLVGWPTTTTTTSTSNPLENRLPVFSFLITSKEQETGSHYYLHHNFVCALLNDLFGLQTRGGCACAGPYSLDLLGINDDLSIKIESALLSASSHGEIQNLLGRERDRRGLGNEIIRPGFVRVSLHYLMDSATVDYILDAVRFVADNGWKFLPLYNFNVATGECGVLGAKESKQRKWLAAFDFENVDGGPSTSTRSSSENVEDGSWRDEFYAESTASARDMAEKQVYKRVNPSRQHQKDDEAFLSSQDSNLRWFLLPSEAVARLFPSSDPTRPNGSGSSPGSPFVVRGYSFNPPVDSSKISTESPWGFEGDSFDGLLDYNDDSPEILSTTSTLTQIINTLPKKYYVPTRTILSPSMEAVEEFGMIKNGDRIIVCVSGGKDSLTMVHLLKHQQYLLGSKGIKFDMCAVTVDPLDHDSFDPRPLQKYFDGLGLEYHLLSQGILAQAKSMENCDSICSFCSRMKRGTLYSFARANGWNVLAIGQHLDDMVESFLMSAFHNGLLRSMKAHYTVKDGDLRIIRPLVYVRERELATFARNNRLPVVNENCPGCFTAPTERHRIKQLLASQELLFPSLIPSLKMAIKPLISIDKTGIEELRQFPFVTDNISP